MYFSKFPILQYPVRIGDTLRLAYCRNILRRVGLTDEITGSDSAFIQYDVKDGERPEHIAERVYGDPEYHWIVLLTNNIINPYHDWYKPDSVMEEYVAKKYTGKAVYFTSNSGQFVYLSDSNGTLVQGSNSSAIKNYEPTLCRVTTSYVSFVEGSASVVFGDGNSQSVLIRRVDDFDTSLHHFEVEQAGSKIQLDPISQRTDGYVYTGGVLGSLTDEYPNPVTSNGLNYSPAQIVDLDETYIGRYMGISQPKDSAYVVTNRQHELNQNDTRRTIKLLHPRFKSALIRELESLLG